MKIRIKSTGEKSSHSWYARYIGQEFEVIEVSPGQPGHYIVDTRHIKEDYGLPFPYTIAYVVMSDAEITDAALAFVREQQAATVQGQPLDAPAAVMIPSEVREAIGQLLLYWQRRYGPTEAYETVRQWLDSQPADDA